MKNIKRISALFLAVLVIVLSLPIVSASNAFVSRRGRNVLGEMIHGDKLQLIYDELVIACAGNTPDTIDINTDWKITSTQLNTIYKMFYRDYPEYFWIKNGGYSYEYIPGQDIVVSISPSYIEEFSDLATAKSAYNEKVNTLTSGLDGKSEYEKSKILHDRLADTVTYKFTGAKDQTSYGALVEGKAVCNGYTRAYQHLLQEVGMEAWYVSGLSYNPVSGNKVDHAWNVVRIDHEYYYTDVTWDDQGENIFYAYFNMTSKQLKEDHIIDEFEECLPVAVYTDANYFVKNNLVFSMFDKEEITNLLKQNNGTTQVYVIGSMDVFKSRFKANVESIAIELGAVGRFSCGTYIIGNAIIMKIEGDFVCRHSYENACDTICDLCGDIRSVIHSYGNWITTKHPTCTEQGSKYQLCGVCSDKVTKSISATGVHTYDNDTDTACNICGTTRMLNTNWKITVNSTGVYKLKPSQNYTGNSKYSNIAVFDKNNNEVIYNEKHNGWPLTTNQTYTVKFKNNSGSASIIIWQLTKTTDTIFPDTDKNGWYNDAVTYAVGSGIMSGYANNGKFGTSDGIQRQDFLVMLARLDGVDLAEYSSKSKFPDVPSGSYFEAAVNWGAKNGIVTGYENGKFGVGDKITREQIVTFLYRYAKYKKLNVGYKISTEQTASKTYTDYKNISTFATDPVLWAIENGVISGKTATTIVPQGNAQRCEVAKIMYNIFLNDIF